MGLGWAGLGGAFKDGEPPAPVESKKAVKWPQAK
ncbi:hypothetical protein AcdelDRAFT_4003 [Acidovorax delafieldii 2AN]|uniref:Uncharacterized protein n=1 Tax=Acidovorax delafieldii 2AN TaxID=573060 RepID=C5TAS3_ACIDE|nr:hypothetical protein AcdelDRAFT_4003 [Acidovorax delafieldii 2AN]